MDTMTDLKISKVLLIYSLFTESHYVADTEVNLLW